jgi:hypothetical protein
MNAYASIGLGQSLVRGLRRRTEEVRTIMTREMVALIEGDYRTWRGAIGPHPADRSAHETITRLRATTGAARAIGEQPLTALMIATMRD